MEYVLVFSDLINDSTPLYVFIKNVNVNFKYWVFTFKRNLVNFRTYTTSV